MSRKRSPTWLWLGTSQRIPFATSPRGSVGLGREPQELATEEAWGATLFSLCCLCALTLVLQVLMKSSGNNPVCVTGTMGLLVRAGGLWSQS